MKFFRLESADSYFTIKISDELIDTFITQDLHDLKIIIHNHPPNHLVTNPEIGSTHLSFRRVYPLIHVEISDVTGSARRTCESRVGSETPPSNRSQQNPTPGTRKTTPRNPPGTRFLSLVRAPFCELPENSDGRTNRYAKFDRMPFLFYFMTYWIC